MLESQACKALVHCGWDESMSFTAAHTVLASQLGPSGKSVDYTAVFWAQLSKTCTVSRVSLLCSDSPESKPRVGRALGSLRPAGQLDSGQLSN